MTRYMSFEILLDISLLKLDEENTVDPKISTLKYLHLKYLGDHVAWIGCKRINK